MAACCLALLLALCAKTAAHAQTTDIVPRPQSVQAIAGAAPVTIADGAAILVPAHDPEALATARELARIALKTRGLHLRPRTGAAARRPAIVLIRRPDPAQGPEGYDLTIAGGQARITAASSAGLFYGATSLWQLMTPDAARGQVTLQPMRIDDRPRFAWRGLLLDSARHFQSPAFVEQLIDWMALHKLNVLQWHLTDDQGWRLQIRRYPRLTSLGAWRGEGAARYGGFYTQAQVRRVVAYARARHVTIVPEIEMPGHALAALIAYPQLASGPLPSPAIENDRGIFPYLYAPTDRSFAFLDNVLTEVMALFPGQDIDVGGDEAVKDEWKASPAIQARIKALGLANEDALQGWFTARVGRFLKAHGRRLVGWDDILAGGDLPADAAVMSWHLGGALKATGQGHDAVIATDPVLYFDHRQSDLPSEPPGRGAVIGLGDVYQYEPAPSTLAGADRAHIIGVQGNVWSEHIRTEERVEEMAFPRAAALAELGWTAPERKDWPDFVQRLPAELARYRPLGLEADTGSLGVKVDDRFDPASGARTLALSNQLGFGQIRYTTDGSVPTAASTSYQSPIPATPPMRLRAATFDGGARVSPILDRPVVPSNAERRVSQELASCSNKLVLNLEGPDAGPGVARPTYLIDIMNPCWIFPEADLGGVAAIDFTVGALPFNFQIGADAAKIPLRPPATPDGELEVRMDSCAGELLATLPLAPAARRPGPTTLTAAIAPHAGRHDLCLMFTARGLDPMWAIDAVRLQPQTQTPTPAKGATP